jgi:tetratricopeptide (TPR) repeat protein
VVSDKLPSSYRNVAAPLLAFEEAVVFHSQGRFREAEQRYQVVLAVNDRHFDALYRLGLIRLQQGRFGDAAKLFRQAIKVDRRSADAHQHLGVALSGLGRHDEAIERYQKALTIKPDLAEAHNNLAHSLQEVGRIDQAKAHYEQALTIRPDYPEACNNLGMVLQTLGRSADAMARYQAALAARPRYPDAHKNLGNLLSAAKRYQEARAHYESVIAIRPNDAQSHTALGDMLNWLDGPDEAITHFNKALGSNPSSIEARTGLGYALYLLGKSEEATSHYRKALAINSRHAETHGRLGEALLSLGRAAEARAAFTEALANTPNKAGAYWNLANAGRFTPDDPHLAAMQELARDPILLSADEQIDLYFALGKAFGDLGETERSFLHQLRGNAIKRRQIDYDEATTLGRLERIRNAFTPAIMREKVGLGNPSEVPVFIVGMPRSGTTLVEQILASHPQVFGAGELRAMANIAERIGGPNGPSFPEAIPSLPGHQLHLLGTEYLNAVRRFAPTAERITDKMPGNFALAGLIHLALPRARIIHVCRDLRDTALSCFSILFARGHEFTYDLGELGRYCAAYRALMNHWRMVMSGVMLEVHYEDIVAGLEPVARRIVAHCGLEWDATCLDFHRTERPVRTASANQVRQPIYRDSIGRWRRHTGELQPLVEALG